MALPSHGDHGFDQVPSLDTARSTFDQSHGHKTTFDGGQLIPILAKEVLPGDTWTGKVDVFARFQTPQAALMDNAWLSTFWFFVPARLVWENWERFNGAQDDPGDSTAFIVPTVDYGAGGATIGSLPDYLSIPTGAKTTGLAFNAMYTRAYNLIWNNWFRDEDLQDSVVVDVDDGPDNPANYVVLRRGKKKDYFVSCRPFLQKGTAVTLPLGTSAPVSLSGKMVVRLDSEHVGNKMSAFLSSDYSTAVPISQGFGTSGATPGLIDSGPGAQEWVLDPNRSLYADASLADSGRTIAGVADLSAATASTIAQLRLAEMTQQILELDARAGTRYVEQLKMVWHVTPDDARLQRPEYLGGGRMALNVHPIPQTSATGATGTPQGNVSAMATVSGSSGITKSFVEHGILYCLVCADAELSYQQGLDRQYSRSTRYDYAHPLLANIGDQAVLNKEIYAQGDGDADDALPFGYQERYGEYRFSLSRITGKFRSTAAGSLDFWHLAEEYLSLPLLDAAWRVSDPPFDRVVAVPTEPHFYFDSWFTLKSTRVLPVFGVPSLGRHL